MTDDEYKAIMQKILGAHPLHQRYDNIFAGCINYKVPKINKKSFWQKHGSFIISFPFSLGLLFAELHYHSLITWTIICFFASYGIFDFMNKLFEIYYDRK